jgi:zinc transporter ZupT
VDSNCVVAVALVVDTTAGTGLVVALALEEVLAGAAAAWVVWAAWSARMSVVPEPSCCSRAK